MGDNGHVLSVRLTDDILTKLDHVVELERAQARPGHKVARSSVILLAIMRYVDDQRRLHRRQKTTTAT
jgi:metal-responsive CopG/Arc/MetJ family transcriptional regulator